MRLVAPQATPTVVSVSTNLMEVGVHLCPRRNQQSSLHLVLIDCVPHVASAKGGKPADPLAAPLSGIVNGTSERKPHLVRLRTAGPLLGGTSSGICLRVTREGEF